MVRICRRVPELFTDCRADLSTSHVVYRDPGQLLDRLV
jgi:hypothetical protein